MKTIKEYSLTNEQFIALSLLATYLINLNNLKYELLHTKNMSNSWIEMTKDSIYCKENMINGIKAVCVFINIPSDLIDDVYYNQFRKGLQNMNKLSLVELF